MVDLFRDILPSILQNKKDVLEDEKDYNPFIVNRALSFHYDCALQANAVNLYPDLSARMQYDFLQKSIRGYKRPYRKWEKRETIDSIEAIKEYYNYSYDKAKSVLPLLNDEQIDYIKQELDKGGVRKKRK